ncbi:MAG: FtsX-like permease family protein [Saprospiraceae bacterium]|nr:FtsX-like permease family protein [Saprospiraceae bacterium]
MNFSLHIARRYLFAKRSTNAINIITGISVVGVAIGTAALILVLSVFNGFEDLLGGLFGHFNPEVKVTAAKGKTFQADSLMLTRLRQIPEVAAVSATIEEIAFFEYDGSQDFGVLKGVDTYFSAVNGIDSTIIDGEYLLQTPDGGNCAVLGYGVYTKLSVNAKNPLIPLTIYMPDKDGGGAMDRPFKTRMSSPVGAFAIQQEFDEQYVLSNLQFVRELLGADSATVSAIEVKCRKPSDIGAVKLKIQEALGNQGEYIVKDQYEQNEAFFKVMRLEKWMGFALTSLMLILMAFNTIGALWMIVLDKQKDISVLKSLGATDQVVRRIFLLEGLLLTFVGMVLGVLLALLLYWLQKHYGLISIPEGFIVDSYPISMRATDFLPVVLTVLSIGFLASLLPARRAMQVPAFLREE